MTRPPDHLLPWFARKGLAPPTPPRRDHTSNGNVQVMLFFDRLEIGNPGVLPPPLSL